ncbi:hypothetical protein [Sporosarcina limicola]|uniref:Uncharacterized protein n=1 Tax=Sporosarcina limicola TaxID=34101 RepID=A0A927MQY9_9BACL|nr:hypothetical protein [Sporosarcina limicola]MBE1555879.1 hypothetical protein [Sporosarcina limicola]
MGLMFTTVIGYAIVLGLAAVFTMHYLAKALNSADAERIDPKPEVKF